MDAPKGSPMYQLVYVSTARRDVPADVPRILLASRVNNRRDDITGLLYFDGTRFLQALEGPEDKVQAAFDRISADTRHRGIVALSKRDVAEREFGDWAMAHRLAGEEASFLARIDRLLAKASPNVRATFESFARLSRAA